VNPDEFRADLCRRLAVEPFLGLADANGVPPGLAERLGVTEATLTSAIAVARGGAGADGPRVAVIDVFLPALLRMPYFGACDVHHLGTNQLLRALLHAAMLTELEPTPRARGRWAAAPGCEAHRARLDGLGRLLVKRTSAVHLSASVSTGLLDALKQRALARRVKYTQYVVLWVADLLDGKLPFAALTPVEATATFVDARSYVLPVLTEPRLTQSSGQI